MQSVSLPLAHSTPTPPAAAAAAAAHDVHIGAQVSEGLVLADFVKQAVAAHYTRHRAMPRDNAASLPDSKLIIGNYVTEVKVREGAASW